MNSVRRSDFLLPNSILLALVVTLAGVIAPHALRLPLWLTGLVLVCGFWRMHLALRGEPLPPSWFRIALTAAVTGGVFFSYGTILGRDAGTALLTAMTALKLLEMRRPRDTQVLLYLAFFLIVTQFLYSQSLWTAGYMLLLAWAITAILISSNRPTPTRDLGHQARLAGSLLLQALPIMAILFVLFPRISGPLWGLPEDAYAGMTGLSDHMTPGSISQLSQSDAVAFRVRFDEPPPPRAQRYWRGPVFSAYDGRTWSSGLADAEPPRLEGRADTGAYTITLQPHDQRWLFALDMPAQPPPGAKLTAHYELRADKPVRELTAYQARSYLDYILAPQLDAKAKRYHLFLPDGAHPQARALAARWRQQTDQPAEILRLAEEWFRSRPFVYTLRPPRLTQDPVDQFLFETRRGFCEHYAGALAVLMRAAGVPARVVTGYQGGETNPAGDYMIVRQSDAHAWTEVWLPGQGWRRVDPTGFISPARVEAGLGEAVGAEEPVPPMAQADGGLFKALRLRLDLLNNQWNQWVIAYGPQLQRQLLSNIGLGSWQRMAGAMGAALGLLLLAITVWLLRGNRRAAPDPVQRLYLRFCRKLARGGLVRLPNEGPQDFARRAEEQRPDLAAQIRAITDLYCQLRYNDQDQRRGRQLLRQQVNGFRP